MNIVRTMLATTAALGFVSAAPAQTSGMSSASGKSTMSSGTNKSKPMARSHRRSTHASTGYNQVSRKSTGAPSGGAMTGAGSGGSTTTMSNTSSGVMSH